MDMHNNARLTPHSRAELVRRVKAGQSSRAVAEAFGVTVKTVRKWVVGIVSRANLLHSLVARQAAATPSADDRTIKASIEAELAEAAVLHEFLSVVVSGGIVHVWGAVRVALQNVPDVKQLREEIRILSPNVRAAMWAM